MTAKPPQPRSGVVEDPRWREEGYAAVVRPGLASGHATVVAMTEADKRRAAKREKTKRIGFS